MARRVIIAFSGWADKKVVSEAFFDLCGNDFSIAHKVFPNTSKTVVDCVDDVSKYLFGIDPKKIENPDDILSGINYSFKNKTTLNEIREKISNAINDVTGNRYFWIYMLERIILSQFREWGETGGVFVIPDVWLASHVKMLGRMRKRGIEVYHYAVMSKDTMPDWLKLGIEPWAGDLDFSLLKDNFEANPEEYEWCLSNPKMTDIISLDDRTMLNDQIRKKIIEHIWK